MTIGGQPMLTARLKAWWLNKLDSDSVRQFVPYYNGALLTWSLLALLWFPPVSTIVDAMKEPAYWMWVWLSVVANGLPLIGLWMRHGGSAVADMHTRLLVADWWGLFFQAAGHALSHVLLLMFEISAIITLFIYNGPNAYPGVTVLLAFVLAPWCLGTLLLTAQCLRKVQRGLQIERQGGVL